MNRTDLWIARRILLSRHAVGWISWSGTISAAGIAFGCAALIIAVAILSGFERQIRTALETVEPDIRVAWPARPVMDPSNIRKQFEGDSRVSSVSGYVEGKGLASGPAGEMLIEVRALESASFERLSNGTIMAARAGGALPAIVLGAGAARNLGTGIGDTLTVADPASSHILHGFPRAARFVVASVFETKIPTLDSRRSYIPMEVGRWLFGGKGESGMEVDLREGTAVLSAARDLRAKLGREVEVLLPGEDQGALFEAMRIEKVASTVALAFVILVASFHLVSTLRMLVVEKTPEIGILKTLGASASRIRRIFATLGGIIGAAGILLGTIAGVGLVATQRYWGWIRLPTDIYAIDKLPMFLSFGDVLIIVGISALMVLGATYFPARQGASFPPADALRIER